MTFWTYILHCNGGSFYVGHTDELDRRIAQHHAGVLPGFTRDHLPVKLVWSDAFSTRYEAQTLEKRLKGWSRALIRGDWDEISRLARRKSEGQAFDKLRLSGDGDCAK